MNFQLTDLLYMNFETITQSLNLEVLCKTLVRRYINFYTIYIQIRIKENKNLIGYVRLFILFRIVFQVST